MRQAPKQAARAQGPHSDRGSIPDQCLLVPQHPELQHELHQEEVAVANYQARVSRTVGRVGTCWPGCHEGTQASILHLLPKASTAELSTADHRGFGDNPTRGLGHQPHEP